MKKLFLVLGVSLFVVACGDDQSNKSDNPMQELLDLKKAEIEQYKKEDERAKKAMDMSKGATVYEIPTPTFGKKSDDKE